MLSLPSSVRVFLCLQPTDMRRSFDGLSMMIQEVIGESPFSGHLFVFCNRRQDRVKVMYWDRDGYAIWYKRLEKGTYRFPCSASDALRAEIRVDEFLVLLEGIDLSTVKRSKRYVRK
jgi:transposase